MSSLKEKWEVGVVSARLNGKPRPYHVVTIGNSSYIGVWCLWDSLHWEEGHIETRLSDAQQWGDIWHIDNPWIDGQEVNHV